MLFQIQLMWLWYIGRKQKHWHKYALRNVVAKMANTLQMNNTVINKEMWKDKCNISSTTVDL